MPPPYLFHTLCLKMPSRTPPPSPPNRHCVNNETKKIEKCFFPSISPLRCPSCFFHTFMWILFCAFTSLPLQSTFLLHIPILIFPFNMRRLTPLLGLSFVCIVCGVIPRSEYNMSYPDVMEGYGLLYVDSRLERPQECLAEEQQLDSHPELLTPALRCWRDSCLCRGGLWSDTDSACSHLCHKVKCDDLPCQHNGRCDPATGDCVYEDRNDGKPCSDAHGMDATFRCYAGLCLQTHACGSTQCTLPASECISVSCSDPSNTTYAPSLSFNTTNTTSPPPTCLYTRLNGTFCSGARRLCLGGTCTAVSPHEIAKEAVRMGLPAISPCEGVVCPYIYHACRVSGGCVDGVCTEEFKPNGTLCDDGVSDTVRDQCYMGSCVGSITCIDPRSGHSIACVVADPECSAPLCDAASGQCYSLGKPDGTACSDGNSGTSQDFCLSGRCMGVSAFYDCRNHQKCFSPLLQCLKPFAPSCAPVYRAQCRMLGAAQRCAALPHASKDFCTAEESSAVLLSLLMVVASGVLVML